MNEKSTQFVENLFIETDITSKLKEKIQNAVLNSSKYPMKIEDLNNMIKEEFVKMELTKTQELRIIRLLETL